MNRRPERPEMSMGREIAGRGPCLCLASLQFIPTFGWQQPGSKGDDDDDRGRRMAGSAGISTTPVSKKIFPGRLSCGLQEVRHSLPAARRQALTEVAGAAITK